jgi:large subunit ribosomal protein L23
MQLSDTLIRPLITEKTTSHLGTEQTYAFEVGLKANKHQIAEAIEDYYGVKVAKVRTQIVRGKTKRFGRHIGKRSNWKKAYVTLAPGDTINLYEAPSA